MTAPVTPAGAGVAGDDPLAAVLTPAARASWRLADHADRVGDVWRTRSADAEVSYPDESHELLAGLEERSLWFRSRNRMVASVLAAHTDVRALLDVGAGNGHVAAFLTGGGVPTVAVEPSSAGAVVAAARGVHASVCGLLEDLGLPDGSVTAVGAFDMIEHLPDDGPLLAEMRRILVPGGWCVLTVPAHAGLWSQADEAAGHHRRFCRDELDRRLVDAGFEAVFSTYAFAGAVLPLYLARARPYRKGRRLSETELNASLEAELAGQGRLATVVGDAAAGAEAWWVRRWRIPLGTSVIGVYRAPPAR